MHPALFKIVNHILYKTLHIIVTGQICIQHLQNHEKCLHRSLWPTLSRSFSSWHALRYFSLETHTHTHTLRNLLSAIRSDDRVPRVDKRNYQEAFHCLVASILQKIALEAKLRRQLSVHFCHRKSPNHLLV